MPFTTLVSTATLAGHLDDPRWVICDCRHDLADLDAGRRAYAAAHIPGARFAHLDEDLSGVKTGSNGRHPLPDPETLAGHFGRWGIGEDTQIVAYDASGGSIAARLWWLARWLGHEAVAVLDGGWPAWAGEDRPVTAELPVVRPARFERRAGPAAVDAQYVLTRLDGTGMLLVDARAPERYAGEVEPLDPVAGHIPGALNRFYQSNLDATGRFKSPAALRGAFAALIGDTPPREVVHQCGSGVTACHSLLAMEIAGLPGSRLYAGSWSEWVSDAGRPVLRGPA